MALQATAAAPLNNGSSGARCTSAHSHPAGAQSPCRVFATLSKFTGSGQPPVGTSSRTPSLGARPACAHRNRVQADGDPVRSAHLGPYCVPSADETRTTREQTHPPSRRAPCCVRAPLCRPRGRVGDRPAGGHGLERARTGRQRLARAASVSVRHVGAGKGAAGTTRSAAYADPGRRDEPAPTAASHEPRAAS